MKRRDDPRGKPRAAVLAAALACGLLGGCLEVEQHPAWRNGAYDGKPDPLPQATYFHGDRLAWWATIDNRHQRQNEYNRTYHRGGGQQR